MIYYLLTICILGLGIVYIKGKRATRKAGTTALFFPSILSVIVFILMFSLEVPLDSKLVEYTAKEVRHYGRWKETINSCVVNHDEYYAMIYSNSRGELKEYDIPEETYSYFTKLWKKPKVLVKDSFHMYYKTEWNKDPGTALVYTRTCNFPMYLGNTTGLYHLLSSSPEKYVIPESLYIRSNRTDVFNAEKVMEPRQTLIYGLALPDSASRELSNISSLHEDFRPILLVWTGSGNKESKIKHQKSLWKGGKLNEVVFCIGISDTIQKKIMWSGSFSWSETKDFEDFVLKSSLHPGGTLKIKEYAESLRLGYTNNLWDPRNIRDYSIVKIPQENFIIILIVSLIIIANLGIVIRIYSKPDPK